MVPNRKQRPEATARNSVQIVHKGRVVWTGKNI